MIHLPRKCLWGIFPCDKKFLGAIKNISIFWASDRSFTDAVFKRLAEAACQSYIAVACSRGGIFFFFRYFQENYTLEYTRNALCAKYLILEWNYWRLLYTWRIDIIVYLVSFAPGVEAMYVLWVPRSCCTENRKVFTSLHLLLSGIDILEWLFLLQKCVGVDEKVCCMYEMGWSACIVFRCVTSDAEKRLKVCLWIRAVFLSWSELCLCLYKSFLSIQTTSSGLVFRRSKSTFLSHFSSVSQSGFVYSDISGKILDLIQENSGFSCSRSSTRDPDRMLYVEPEQGSYKHWQNREPVIRVTHFTKT